MAAAWLAAWVAITLILAGGGENDRVVDLTLAPRFERDSLRALTCEVRFQGENDGETRLVLPDAWGGARDLWANLRGIEVEGSGARLAAGDGPTTRVIHHAPGAMLRVRYHVVPAAAGVPTAGSGNDYRPIIQPGYFHTIGYTLWALPEWSDQTPVRFTVRDLPNGWSFASDLEHAAAGATLPLGAARQSILVGGDFRVLRGASDAGGMRLAIRGKWTFSDGALFTVLAKVANTQRHFFRDPSEPYLVTVLPLAGDSTIVSAGGTGLGDAFAYFGTANVPQSTMERTLVHEHLHTWVPSRLGRMPSSNEIGDYWFSEGFTDFLTLRLLVRDGTWDVAAWIREADRILGEYGRSPVCEAPNSRIMEAFWSDPDVRLLPYQRGFLLAMQWDAQLRDRSKGVRDLDDVLIAMRDSTRRPSDRHATDRLIDMLEREGLDAKRTVERHVTRGERIRWAETLFGPQARVLTEQVPEFTRGFDIQATVAADRVIAGVDSLGPAYAAGMRNGMRLVKRESGVIGDSRVELAYRVSEDGSERVISYLPAGKRRFEVQRVALADSSAAGQAALRKLIAGG